MEGVMKGVAWTLPRSMIAELGGRLTGSLAVSFLPDVQQRRDASDVASASPPPEAQHLLAHSVIYGPDGAEHWAPGQRQFIRLLVKPHLPSDADAAWHADRPAT
jgi:hypothetical protein